MGNSFSNYVRWILTGRRKFRVLMVGLDDAGKTTILYQLKRGERAQTIPTVGFNVEDLHIGNIDLKIWDVGGQSVVRELWSHYMGGEGGGVSAAAVVFVIDSSDIDRLQEARWELMSLMQTAAAKNTVLMVLANKQDLSNALNADQITEGLNLSVLTLPAKLKACAVFEVTALTGKGLQEAMDWLVETLLVRNGSESQQSGQK